MKQTKKEDLVSEKVVEALQEEITKLKTDLDASKEREKRVLADYQNLQRRFTQEKLAFIKMANKDLCEALLQPLEHLSMAANSIQDQGLNMVVSQFWKELANFGLAEIEVMGKKFDVKTMEVVDKKGEGETVVAVVRKGYILNDEIIQHAQVVLG